MWVYLQITFPCHGSRGQQLPRSGVRTSRRWRRDTHILQRSYKKGRLDLWINTISCHFLVHFLTRHGLFSQTDHSVIKQARTLLQKQHQLCNCFSRRCHLKVMKDMALLQITIKICYLNHLGVFYPLTPSELGLVGSILQTAPVFFLIAQISLYCLC